MPRRYDIPASLQHSALLLIPQLDRCSRSNRMSNLILLILIIFTHHIIISRIVRTTPSGPRVS